MVQSKGLFRAAAHHGTGLRKGTFDKLAESLACRIGPFTKAIGRAGRKGLRGEPLKQVRGAHGGQVAGWPAARAELADKTMLPKDRRPPKCR